MHSVDPGLILWLCVCPQSVIKNTPAASIAPTALKTGWLRKEGKGNKAFKRRFFVLWSTPDAVARMVRTNHYAQVVNSRQELRC